MTKWNCFWAIHYAFLLGISISADYTTVVGAEYAFATKLYFVIGNTLAMCLFSWPLFRTQEQPAEPKDVNR